MNLAIFLLSCLSGLIWLNLIFFRGGFWRLRSPQPIAYIDYPKKWPAVVAIVPARNEEDVIEQAITSLLEQDYAGDFHIIVVDDHSTDQTANIVQKLIDHHPAGKRLILKKAEKLPEGWSGKVWAQSQGMALLDASTLSAEYILLTDADIAHPRQAVTQLVARALLEQRDLVSLMVRLKCHSWWEKACVPAFVFFFAKLYPFSWINDPNRSTAGAAGGCMLVKRNALNEIGGIQSIRNALIDDCTLAARIKHRSQQVHSIRLDVAERSISLRAYDHWQDIWNMIARTAFTQLRYSFWYLLLTLLGMCLVYIMPLIGAIYLKGYQAIPAYLALFCMFLSYIPILRYYHRHLLWVFALPLIALFYQGATVASAIRYWRGQGGQWKTRVQAPLDHK